MNEVMGVASEVVRRMRWLLLLLQILTTCQPCDAIVDTCDVCGRRPLVPVHDVGQLQIMGRAHAQEGDWPWIVSLQLPTMTGHKHTCGGSLITARWILTAAHCFGNKRNIPHWRAVIGATQLSALGSEVHVRYVKQVVLHEEYQPITDYNDIALMELDKPIKCSNFIQPACVPNSSVAVPALTHCYISGWGVVREHGTVPSDLMQEAKVKRFDTEMCNSSTWYNGAITKHSLCAGYEEGGTDSCQGDSGGPLMCRENPTRPFWVIGITSWGLGCARPRKPGVYTSTQHFYNWIKGWAGPLPQPPFQPLTMLAQTPKTLPTTTTTLFQSQLTSSSTPEVLPEPLTYPQYSRTHPPNTTTTALSPETQSEFPTKSLSLLSAEFHSTPTTSPPPESQAQPEAPSQPEPEISFEPESSEAPTQSEPKAPPQPSLQPESKTTPSTEAPTQTITQEPLTVQHESKTATLPTEAPTQTITQGPLTFQPESKITTPPTEAPTQTIIQGTYTIQPESEVSPPTKAPLQPCTQPESEATPQPEALPKLEPEGPQLNAQPEPQTPPHHKHKKTFKHKTSPTSEVPAELKPHHHTKASHRPKSHSKSEMEKKDKATVSSFFNLLEKFLHAIRKEKDAVWPKLTQLELTAEENMTALQNSEPPSATNLHRKGRGPCQDAFGVPCGKH